MQYYHHDTVDCSVLVHWRSGSAVSTSRNSQWSVVQFCIEQAVVQQDTVCLLQQYTSWTVSAGSAQYCTSFYLIVCTINSSSSITISSSRTEFSSSSTLSSSAAAAGRAAVSLSARSSPVCCALLALACLLAPPRQEQDWTTSKSIWAELHWN